MLKNLNKREKMIAAITLLVGLTALLYSFVVEPVFSKRVYLNQEIESRKAVFAKDLRILSRNKTIEAEFEEFSKNTESPLSGSSDVAEVMNYIETSSRNDDCHIVNIKPLGTQSKGIYKEVSVEISAEGNIDQFAKLLYDMENPRSMLLKLKRFSISSKSSGAGGLKGIFVINKVLLD